MAESNRDIKEEYYLVCEKRWDFMEHLPIP